jgi:LPXTG-site transpeptidase (sortase) family protein
MPSRGSAQLLLLFFRSRPRLGWTMGAMTGVLVVAGLLQAGGAFPLMTRMGLAQMLHQSAWQHALAGLPEVAPWPWASASQATIAEVPQLGLSASVIKETGPGNEGGSVMQPASGEDQHAPRTKLSEMGVGDRITVTTQDGSSRDYRITGRKVVDPHLAETVTGPSDADATLVTCMPLDPLLASSLSLVIQATKVDPPASPDPGSEQKL